MESMDMEVASEFIVMAATLLQIKSKMLIPVEKESMSEIAFDADDPGRNWLKGLSYIKSIRKYQKF
jgi:segregation and condensation protein A